MQEATKHADFIREDIKDLKHRHTIINTLAKCDGPNCYQPILNNDFYLFSCNHAFHSNCLYEEVLQHVGESKKRRIIDLNEKRNRESKSMQASPQWSLFGLDTEKHSQPDADKLQSTMMDEMREFDDLIASECPYCGDMMISTVDMPFKDEGEDMREWDLDVAMDTTEM